MCKDCCARQKYGVLVCKCSVQVVQANLAQKKEILSGGSIATENLCEKCPNKKDMQCVNKMCHACCPIQAIRFECPYHDESYYCKEMISL